MPTDKRTAALLGTAYPAAPYVFFEPALGPCRVVRGSTGAAPARVPAKRAA